MFWITFCIRVPEFRKLFQNRRYELNRLKHYSPHNIVHIHRSTVLTTQFHYLVDITKDPKECKNLMFDKITNLNGYEVRLNAISYIPHLIIDYTKPGLDKFSGDNGEIVKLLFKKLNATLNVMIYNGTAYELGGLGPHGTMVGMLADVSSGRVDMGMNVRSLHAMWKIEYVFTNSNINIVKLSHSEFTKND